MNTSRSYSRRCKERMRRWGSSAAQSPGLRVDRPRKDRATGRDLDRDQEGGHRARCPALGRATLPRSPPESLWKQNVHGRSAVRTATVSTNNRFFTSTLRSLGLTRVATFGDRRIMWRHCPTGRETAVAERLAHVRGWVARAGGHTMHKPLAAEVGIGLWAIGGSAANVSIRSLVTMSLEYAGAVFRRRVLRIRRDRPIRPEVAGIDSLGGINHQCSVRVAAAYCD